MSMKDAVLSRKPQPVEIDGDTFHVRSLTLREAHECEAMSEIDQALYGVRKGLVDESGNRVFAEDDDAVNDIPLSKLVQLYGAVNEATKPPSRKAILKNSEDAPSSVPA